MQCKLTRVSRPNFAIRPYIVSAYCCAPADLALPVNSLRTGRAFSTGGSALLML